MTNFVTTSTPAPANNPQTRQPRPQRNFKKIALAPHDVAGNFYLI